jgi:HK97 gp10 family phage protein
MKNYTWPNSDISLKENISDLLADFLKKPESLSPVVKKHALNIQANAAKDAPVDTGALKNSIIAEPIDQNNYTITDGVEYGVFQELGTKKTSAKHFLGGAAEREAETFFADVRKALTE